MPTNDARRDEIRTILLSCLLARQGLTPVTVLDRDYYEAEGERIPWRKFGYNDLVEFLNSMPEHFALEWYNGGHYVRGIASEKTKHVSSLVARQKTASRPMKLKYIPPSFRQARPIVGRFLTPMQRQRVRIPAEQLSYLITYVKKNPNGVTLPNALMMLQKQLPHVSLSIYDLRDQLRELSHSLYINLHTIYPKSVNDVSPEVNNHLQPATSELQTVQQQPPVMQTICVGGDEESDFLEDFSDGDDFVPVNHQQVINSSKQMKTSERLAASFPQNADNEQNSMFNRNDDIDVDEYFAAANNNDNLNTNMTVDFIDLSTLISSRTKSRLDQLIRKHPEGIWCANLPEKYLKEYNVPLNYMEIGFSSVREYVSYLPDIFYMIRTDSTADFLLYSVDNKPTVAQQELTKTVPNEIAQHEQQDEHNSVRTQSDIDDNTPIPVDVSSTITQKFAPDDVMNYDDSVSPILVTDLQKGDKKYLEVYIVEIFNPTFFWVHLRKNKRGFDSFMNDIHTFYQFNKDKYIIPKIALKKGLNCACIYDDRWHRGIIKTVKPDFRVTVMFYDYGTLKTYAAEDVYYLHKRFSHLQAQAIPCALYNVRPCVGDRWKKSVIDQLIDKVNETLLALTIISVDPLNNSMMVILSDTSEEEDVHINDWLIKEKLARCGKMGDAVDMASIMKYVVNHSNQLPTYCFAEESLMTDSHCKATSTEEIPLLSSQQTHLPREGLEQHSVRPPPGFAPLDEKLNLSNMSMKSFNDIYSFGNTSNVKTSTYGNAEPTTNPFLNNQFVNDNIIPNDIAKQIFMPLWKDNARLFIKLTDILRGILECSPVNRSTFEKYITPQYYLNQFLKNLEKLSLDNNQSTINTSSTPFNTARETIPDKVGSSENMPYNPNVQHFMNQKLAGMSNLSNPFNDNRLQQPHNVFPACGSNSYMFKTDWHQPDGFSPRVQVPSTPLTPTFTRSMFTNYGSPATTTNTFFPNVDQVSEPSATKSVPSMNISISNNDCNSSNFNTANNEFTNVFKETNPFKFSMTNDMQVSEKQNEQMAKNYSNSASYLSAKNRHDYSSKKESLNIHMGNNNFMAAEHINVNNAKNYTSKIVYEAGPVMYNTQNKQTDIGVKHGTCNVDLKNDSNVSFKGHCTNKELSSQSTNDITTLYPKHDNSNIDEGYVTRPPTDYMLQSSPSIINKKSSYHQQNENNEKKQSVSSQTWKHIEIPEHWINSQLKNGTPLQNQNEKSTINTLINFSPPKDWNYNIESVTRSTNGTTDLSYIFQWNDKERSMDIYKNLQNNPPDIRNQKFAENKNMNIDFFPDTRFVFQKVDLVKNTIFIFHIDGEGWILTHEFVDTFTNIRLCSRLMAVLEVMNIKIAFKEIQRSDYPAQFSQLDHYSLNAPRDTDQRIVSINLISLQAALSLLHKLKLVTREEIDNAFKKNKFEDNSILPDMWTLIVVYRDLKRRIDEYKLWNIGT